MSCNLNLCATIRMRVIRIRFSTDEFETTVSKYLRFIDILTCARTVAVVAAVVLAESFWRLVVVVHL